MKLLASLSSRDAIIQPIFTLKKCLIYPQQTAKNMYIHHFLFLKGFLYTNILFKIPTCWKRISSAEYCCSSSSGKWINGNNTSPGTVRLKWCVMEKVNEICTVQVCGCTLTFLSEVNIRISRNPPISLFHCKPWRILINSSKQISRKFSMLSPAFFVWVLRISYKNLLHEHRSFTSRSLACIFAKRSYFLGSLCLIKLYALCEVLSGF